MNKATGLHGLSWDALDFGLCSILRIQHYSISSTRLVLCDFDLQCHLFVVKSFDQKIACCDQRHQIFLLRQAMQSHNKTKDTYSL